MKSIIRTVLLGGLAMLALSLATAGVAAAATLPEFKPGTAQTFTAGSGPLKWTWENGNGIITCPKGTETGEITGARTLGKLKVVFTGCTATYDYREGSFPVNSLGSKNAGEIAVVALKGELGTVATKEAASGVGILLKPESGNNIWVDLEGGTETPLEGSVVAEVATIGKKQATNKLVFAAASGNEKIREIKLDSGEVVKPRLTDESYTMVMENVFELTFKEALEVT